MSRDMSNGNDKPSRWVFVLHEAWRVESSANTSNARASTPKKPSQLTPHRLRLFEIRLRNGSARSQQDVVSRSNLPRSSVGGTRLINGFSRPSATHSSGICQTAHYANWLRRCVQRAFLPRQS